MRLGFAVKRGERGIAIIAPLPVKDRDRVSGEETGETLVLFKTVFVFDRAQVAPIDGVEQASLEPPCEPLTGDSHAHLLEPLRAFAESLGFSLSFEPIAGPAGGWCDQQAKRIVVDADAPANARLRTPIHETIHGLGIGYSEYGRERAEVIVDTTTHLACASVGLRVDGETVPYVAGWGEDGALEALTEFAKTIDELARRVESVLAGEHGQAGGGSVSTPSAGEHVAQLVKQRGARDQLKAPVDPRHDNLARRSGLRDHGRDEHVCVQDDAHQALSTLGAPLATHRVQLLVGDLKRLVGV